MNVFHHFSSFNSNAAFSKVEFSLDYKLEVSILQRVAHRADKVSEVNRTYHPNIESGIWINNKTIRSNH